MPQTISINIDDIINRLVQQRGKTHFKQVNLIQNQIRALCVKSRQIFMSQPMLLQLDAPIKVCGNSSSPGDIHGQFPDLLRIFDYCSYPPEANYLFLGDYVDRGKYSIETMSLILAYKIKYPQNFFVLRGNHQCASISRMYGFYDECKRRYNVKIWKSFCDTFKTIPICALIDDRIICMHGGISPQIKDFEQIIKLNRPSEPPQSGLFCDILWADPQKGLKGFVQNDRGVSYCFGQDAVREFITNNDLDLICRAHQVVQEGYEFFAQRQLVTIFSAPNYCGEFDNAAAIMNIDQQLMCSFQVIKTIKK